MNRPMAQNYTVEELLLDESFIEFCLYPESPGFRKWKKRIAKKSITPETLDEALSILNMFSPRLSSSEIMEEVIRLRELIGENSKKDQDDIYPHAAEKAQTSKMDH